MTSTQLYNWKINDFELTQKRTVAHNKAIKRINDLNEGLDPVSDSFLPSITVENEIELVKRYLFIMLRLFESIQSPKLPVRVYGFAAHYFKRFYLNFSMMDHYPREIMLTCLYLACKCADFPIGVQTFVSYIPRNQERYSNFIVNSELFIIDAIGYDLFIHTPYRPYKGLVIDFLAYSVQTGKIQLKDSSQLYQNLIDQGIETIHKWFQTDLCFTIAPCEFALAVLTQMSDIFKQYDLDIEAFIRNELCECDPIKKTLCENDEDELDSISSNSDDQQTNSGSNLKPTEHWEQLRQTLQQTHDYIKDFKFINSLIPTSVDGPNLEEILEKCRNPLFNPGTQEYEEARSLADNSLL